MERSFDHEKLKVYREGLRFVELCDEILKRCPGGAAAKDQLDRASTSIVLNIAEGNGRYSGRDRARFLQIARGSALECAACLDVLRTKQQLDPHSAQLGKDMLREIVSMLIGLLRSVSGTLKEDDAFYDPSVLPADWVGE